MCLADTFLDIFRRSLSQIDNRYYRINSNDIVDMGYPNHIEIQSYFERYNERVFCYELYHQVRKYMDYYSTSGNTLFEGVLLQGELKKDYIPNILEEMCGVQRLVKEYMPDFLLHCPGSFDNQEYVIEVKSNPIITFQPIWSDLKKINEFIEKYRYKRGIFLTINTEFERIRNILINEEKLLNSELTQRGNIILMCKKDNTTPLYECTLDDIGIVF